MNKEFLELYYSDSCTKLEKFKKFFRNNNLTAEETRFLFKKYYEELARGVQLEDSEARTILILAYERYITWLLYRDFNHCTSDFEQVGLIGLINAVDSYNLESDVNFTTYAYVCIKNTVIKQLNIDKKEPEVESLDEVHSDEDNGWTLYDMLGGNDEFIEKLNSENYYKTIFCYLPPVHQFIMLSYFGRYKKPLKQAYIAKLLNYSHERVRQIIDFCSQKLKLILADSNYLSDVDKKKQARYKRDKYPLMNETEYLKHFNELKAELNCKLSVIA